MRRHLLTALPLVVGVLLLLPAPAAAQQDAYALTAVNFNFANPGARARGIGGAFVALADDATASLANPAGIAFLDRQFSLEVMRDEEEFPVGQLQQGSVAIEPVELYLNLTPSGDPSRVRATSDSNRLNYASFTFPIKAQKMAIGLYYAALADLDVSFHNGDSLACADASGHPYVPGAGQTCAYNLSGTDMTNFALYLPQDAHLTLETSLLGAAAGLRLNDRWSVGLSLAMASAKLTGRALVDMSSLGLGDYTEQTAADDNDLVSSLGLLYRGRKGAFGVNYRTDASFNIDSQVLDDSGQVVADSPIGGQLTVPSRLAVGFALLPTDNWVIAAEADRIAYSDLLKKADLVFDPTLRAAGISFATDDVTEYHLGVEYTTFREQQGWSLRAGWWRDKTHLPYGTGQLPDPVTSTNDMVQAAQVLLRAKADQGVDHYTVGGGFATGGVRFDVAVDFTSNAGTDVLLSGVFYF